MKNLFYLIIAAAFFVSCNEKKEEETPAATDESVEQGASENITPQLEKDTGSRYSVDTVTKPE